jgi:protease-4
MGAVAASGGYYVASAASEIWADPSTLTGSIGIFYGKVDVVGLADLIGVQIENFRRGEHAGADGIYRPFTDEERAALAEALRTYYRLFLSRVAEGRGMTVEAVDAVARGRVYSGDAAQSLGLVDRLGGFASALLRARELGGLGRDAEVVVRPPRKSGLLDYLVGGGLSAAVDDSENEAGERKAVAVPRSLRPLLRAAATLDRLGVGQPLALLPYELDM